MDFVMVSMLFQSTPPRRRRLLFITERNAKHNFSIHASAKEATLICILIGYLLCFSIHASAKEATFYFSFILFCFIFSIHASAKEATSFCCLCTPCHYIFNPRLREGGDPLNQHTFERYPFFQSTPPRRRRQFQFSIFLVP